MTRPPSAGEARATVTVLTSSFGGGHRMIAQTVAAAVRDLRPQWDVEVLDFFEEFVGPKFSRAVAWSYGFSARNAPFLYGSFYRTAQWVGEHPRVQSRLNRVGRRRLREYLRSRRPDVVVSTYPTPSAVLCGLKRRGEVSVPSVTILTDCASHSQWIHEGVDLYIVGHDALREELVGLGVPGDRVQASGVPVRPGFTPRDDCPADGPVLITVGAEGMLRGAEALCRAVAECAPRTIVVCGHDRALQRALESLAPALDGALEVYPFVEDIHRHYTAASLFVGKPGGVTVAEALAVGLPLVLYGAIPGQERANQSFVVAGGAGRAARTIREVCAIVTKLLADPDQLAGVAQRAAALGLPNAARDAASSIIDLVERA
ncbi:MAG: glycosyltransferase [Armatimonadetes bacterium]|nr:glycosyltransferase [Armatimonadota bacterium]